MRAPHAPEPSWSSCSLRRRRTTHTVYSARSSPLSTLTSTGSSHYFRRPCRSPTLATHPPATQHRRVSMRAIAWRTGRCAFRASRTRAHCSTSSSSSCFTPRTRVWWFLQGISPPSTGRATKMYVGPTHAARVYPGRACHGAPTRPATTRPPCQWVCVPHTARARAVLPQCTDDASGHARSRLVQLYARDRPPRRKLAPRAHRARLVRDRAGGAGAPRASRARVASHSRSHHAP